MSNLWQELKRRNVFRVGVAYVVVAWLIIQVIETVSDPLGLPDWTEAFFIVVLLAGLPVILLFSWAFELTPEGLKKTAEVTEDQSVTATTGKKLNQTIIIVLVLALGYFLWERQGLVEQAGQAETVAEEAAAVEDDSVSIAVLPFVNMSADPEQEYFSDGISEELLNLLAKIPDLRVPARTSSFQFKGQNLDIGEVAKQLNVKHVLEGSVRRADVRVRVTAQLIEADTGYHLWSETYDRELDDIFAIQDEISEAIVSALSDQLGLAPEAAPHVTAAANPEAYNAYLLGQHLIKLRTTEDIQASIPNFERAIELDPDYAPAHAGLGLAWYLLSATRSTYGTIPLEQAIAKGLPYVETALRLEGDLPEALGVMGLMLHAREQHEDAIPYFEQALSRNPSLTSVRAWYSQALASLGEIEQSNAQVLVAYENDPLSILALVNYANDLVIQRDFDKVGPVIERLEQVDRSGAANYRARILIAQGKAAEGLIHELRGVDLDPSRLRHRSSLSFNLWNLGFEEAALQIWPNKNFVAPLIFGAVDLDLALELAQRNYDENPDSSGALETLAWRHWDLGHVDEALRLAETYLDTLGPTRRRIDGANMMIALDAWRRGDEATASSHLQPLEEHLERERAAGLDYPWLSMKKAHYLQIRGETDQALRYLERALERSVVHPGNLEHMFESMGWNDVPEFVAVKEKHKAYIERERKKLLAVACGPDGFQVWQPSAEDCGRASAPRGPI